MVTLTGSTIYLRALEPEDLEFIYRLENNETLWSVSNTQTPYSRFLIRQYLENAHQDIYEAKQLRLAICLSGSFGAIGLIDLFDFDPTNQRAGVGIVIQNPEDRSKGYAKEALQLVINYSFKALQLHQLYANIDVANVASTSLFTNFGFRLIGIKKDWNRRENLYFDEALYQLVNKL
ncbi:GNAT family N-acetyltransferase [Flavobacterium sp. Sd200]|uniref:GNAT family N-acetyltransferase n=1 Tax=Flavobacterium sp. Sd200 TaxID=2692211 RepID=UPI00136BAA11|nr:GNAT family N-acetyltransferase [Flavobacterium sp. Sd200]MXN89817.1 GNAT family N-acetyltransferase [Flavobacterium sp. Sd200]